MIQRYLPEVRKGDKRIIIIDGEPIAGLNRIPSEGEARSNMHVGGRPELSPLTDREREICATIGPKLKELDMIFVGIDVIGVLSPPGDQRHLAHRHPRRSSASAAPTSPR